MHISTTGMIHDCRVRKIIYKKLLVPNGILQYLKLWTKIFILLLLNIQSNLALANWLASCPPVIVIQLLATCKTHAASHSRILFTDLEKTGTNGRDPETENFVSLICRHFISSVFFSVKDHFTQTFIEIKEITKKMNRSVSSKRSSYWILLLVFNT